MKSILAFTTLVLLAACNSKEPAKDDAMKSGPDSTMAMKDINSPYPILYSSKFVMGDPKNAETLLGLWKDWDGGDLMAARSKFADSFEMHSADGFTMVGKTDSVLKNVQDYRNNYTKSESTVFTIFAAKSVDKNEDWACIWGLEKMTDKKGKADSSYLQETWRFNKDGKADLLYQFKAATVPPKMMKK